MCVFASLHPLSLSPLRPSPPLSHPPPFTPKLHPTPIPMASAPTSLQVVLLASIRVVQSSVLLAPQFITHSKTHVNESLCKPRSFEKPTANRRYHNKPQQTTRLLALMLERLELPLSKLADAQCWALKWCINQIEQSSLLATAPINWRKRWER